MKKLSVQELAVLSDFNYTRTLWNSDDTKTVKIEYDNEYNDFAVITSEKNVRKNRISKLQAEITAWAENKLTAFKLQGFTVSVFQLVFENDTLGIELGLMPQTETPATADSLEVEVEDGE